jgi:hypothetical protein
MSIKDNPEMALATPGMVTLATSALEPPAGAGVRRQRSTSLASVSRMPRSDGAADEGPGLRRELSDRPWRVPRPEAAPSLDRLRVAGGFPWTNSLVCANCQWCCICSSAGGPLSQMYSLLDASRNFIEAPSASTVSSHALDRSEERIYDNLELCRKHLTLALLRSIRTLLRTRVMAERVRERQQVPEASGSRGRARSGAFVPLKPELAPAGRERQAPPNERGARARR